MSPPRPEPLDVGVVVGVGPITVGGGWVKGGWVGGG